MTDSSALPVPTSPTAPPVLLTPLAAMAAIPEEEIWLSAQKSVRIRCAYRFDVRPFMKALSITTQEQRRQVDHRAVIAWERIQREQEGAAPPPPQSAAAWRRCRAFSGI
jgi:hypothetical protein